MTKEENKKPEKSAPTEPVGDRPAAAGKIEPRILEREMEESYLDYAMSVIVSRALPDVRDGLKPVHRRVLYAMHELGLRPAAKYRKSATVVGDVLGKYHPHGDTAVYDTLVRLAQPFAMRYRLVDGQGNFGSIDGDSAAAMRYTEARMTALAEEMLSDIDKETVPFLPNFDGTREEPAVLPARAPNLLLNGALGIAVGMATNIPPHNLTEVCQALIHSIDHPEATLEDLMEFVKGPDFPTGGLIFNVEDIKTAYATGKGRIVMRGVAEIEERERGSQIVISALPYQVNKAELVAKIAELVKSKKVEGISDLRDESDRQAGVRIVIDLKANAYPKKILNALYASTVLESAFHVNLLALVDGLQPRVLTLKQALEEYLKHRIVMVRRRTEFELTRARDRAHILEGLQIALDQIDAVIETIKKSEHREAAHKNLIACFKLTDLQANAILEMRLAALAALERQKVLDELKERLALIVELEGILASEAKIRGLIKAELEAVIDRHGDERRTKIIPHAVTGFKAEDLIPNEPVIVTFTAGGYIKRVPAATYRSQHRGGHGLIGMGTKEEDRVEHVLSTWTHHDLLLFTNQGRLFVTKIYELPVGSRQAKGLAIPNVIQIAPDERVTALIALDPAAAKEGQYFFMGTEKGIVKKTAVVAYSHVRKTGIIAIKLRDTDTLRWVATTTGQDRIMLASRNGQAILFAESDVRPMGRSASGVTGMRLRAGDRVMAMAVIPSPQLPVSSPQGRRGRKPDGPMLLTVLENGYGKRTRVEEFRGQRRGGIGVRAARTTAKTGPLVGALITTGDLGDLVMISSGGVMIRMPLKSVKKLGRDAQGVTLMRLRAGDRVSSVAVVQKGPEIGDRNSEIRSTAETTGLSEQELEGTSQQTNDGTKTIEDSKESEKPTEPEKNEPQKVKKSASKSTKPPAASPQSPKSTLDLPKLARKSTAKLPGKPPASRNPNEPNYWGSGKLWEKPK